MNIGQEFKNGVATIIQTLGSNCQYARGTSAPISLRLVISSIPKEESELINAVGLDGSIAYLNPVSPAPEKFDIITTPGGTRYAVHHVGEILVDSAIVGYKLGLKQ